MQKQRGVMCFGCGGLCKGGDEHRPLVVRSGGPVSYLLQVPFPYRPTRLLLYGKPEVELRSVRVGVHEQLTRACLIHLFAAAVEPGHVGTARRVSFDLHGHYSFPIVERHTPVVVETAEPIDDILMPCDYLAE